MSPQINADAQRWNMTPSTPIPPDGSIIPGLSMRAECMVQEYIDRQHAPEVRAWIHQQRENYPDHWSTPQRDQAARLDLAGWQLAGCIPSGSSRRQSAAVILCRLRQQQRAAIAFSSDEGGNGVQDAIEQPVEYNRLRWVRPPENAAHIATPMDSWHGN